MSVFFEMRNSDKLSGMTQAFSDLSLQLHFNHHTALPRILDSRVPCGYLQQGIDISCVVVLIELFLGFFDYPLSPELHPFFPSGIKQANVWRD
jgi:hypothetical protein